MWNSYRVYLSESPSDYDSEVFDFENETDSDFFCGDETDSFMNEDINDLEDLFWNK